MGGSVLLARYACGLGVVIVIADDTATSDNDEGDVHDETVAVAVAVFAVFWTTEDDVWNPTSLFSVSAAAAATATATDVLEGCFWWEVWWCYGYG